MWKPSYVTVDEAKEYLRIPESDTADDTRLGLDIAAASRAIDRATKRQFGKADEAVERRFSLQYDRTCGAWMASITDLMDLTGLEVTCGTVTTGYTLYELNAAADGEPYTEIRFPSSGALDTTAGGLHVTALWGWAAVPDTIKDATLLQMARFFKRSDAPFGVAGSPDSGSEIRLLAKADPDVAVMVADYRRDWWAA